MRDFLREIKTGFGNATSLYRIMAINVGVFLLIQLARLIVYFSGASDDLFEHTMRSWFALPSDLSELLYKPWTLLTYMFLHFGILHIFFNLLVLYWTGKLLTEYLGNNRMAPTFILGGLTGAVLYILIYNVFPVFGDSVKQAVLFGASAGGLAVLVAVATLLPDYTVQIILIGIVRLKYIALFLIVLYAISIPDGNAGGNISHLGGALFGFVMIRQLRKGRDITSWMSRIGNRVKRPSMRVVESKKKRSETDEEYYERKQSRQEVIDGILDKISQSGYSSLTSEEKDILFKASKNIKD
jgi:membrane associated rhomboid family serine protease